MANIIIFVNDLDSFSKLPYFVHLMIPSWRAAGHVVQIRASPSSPRAAADTDAAATDLALMHIDLTRIPPACLDTVRNYPGCVCVNCAALDISKRRVSRNLVTPGDTYAGPVIVKTDANCGGAGERIQRYGTPLLGRLRRERDRWRHWRLTGRLSFGDYAIYASKREVPAAIWRATDFVVERFLPERHENLYALRQWVFLGDREISRIAYSEQPIIKANNVVASERLDHVPETLRGLRRDLGFDYGKFDYVMRDGEAILLDANRTPTFGRLLGEKGKEYAALLATGIDTFLT